MQPTEITAFQWATFAIACVGATTGALSLGWSVRQFFLAGHRVVVEVTRGATVDP